MQKLIETQGAVLVPAASSGLVLDMDIPEECIVKRVVCNVVQLGTNAITPGVDDEAYLCTVTQSDDGTASIADQTSVNRIVRARTGGAWTPCILDFTLTMRKLTDSGIHLIISNLSSTDSTYYVSLIIHYLED